MRFSENILLHSQNTRTKPLLWQYTTILLLIIGKTKKIIKKTTRIPLYTVFKIEKCSYTDSYARTYTGLYEIRFKIAINRSIIHFICTNFIPINRRFPSYRMPLKFSKCEYPCELTVQRVFRRRFGILAPSTVLGIRRWYSVGIIGMCAQRKQHRPTTSIRFECGKNCREFSTQSV